MSLFNMGAAGGPAVGSYMTSYPSYSYTPPAAPVYAPAASPTAQTPTASTLTADQQSAQGIINDALRQWGLQGLGASAWQSYLQGLPIDSIMQNVRQSPEYQARFPGMAQLQKQGMAISEADYIAKERADQELMRAYGMPDQMVTDRNELGNLIGNGVSTAELQQRLELRKQIVDQLPVETKDYLQRVEGVNSGDLIGFWENPDVALPAIQQKVRAAQVGAAAQQAGFNSLDPQTALRLAGMHNLDSLGMANQEQLNSEFGKARQLAGLTQALPGQRAGVSQDQLINAAVGGDAQAQLAVQQAQDAAKAQFAGGGDYLTGSKGASGLGQNLA
jgi:hypothetical protein